MYEKLNKKGDQPRRNLMVFIRQN